MYLKIFLFLLSDLHCVDILLLKITQKQQSLQVLLYQNVTDLINTSKTKVHYSWDTISDHIGLSAKFL